MITINLNKKLFFSNESFSLDVNLEFEEKSFIALFGKSGAGKTSILKMIAGLMEPDKGFINVNGEIWVDTKKNFFLQPQERKIGFVFQNYSLFPNMTVRENLEFAMPDEKDFELLNHLMEIMEMQDFAGVKPSRLSGGQKQRIAIARALIRKPKILLLDEPLSALDMELGEIIKKMIISLHKEFGLTTIFISHNITDVLKLSERIYVIDKGRIIIDGDTKKIVREYIDL